LENILKNGLKSRNELLSQDIDFEDTADRKIVEKRGILNNYIPFHIDWIQDVHGIPYNYAIFEKNGYDNMIFLDSDWSIIVYSEESFKKVKELLEKHQNDYANIKILIKPNFF